MKPISNDPITDFRTVGLALTMQCNFECAHCITESSPLNKEFIHSSEVFRLIDDIGLESRGICFTGGESLLKKDLLIKCIKRAINNNLVPTLVTNGYWANDEESTKNILEELSNAGLYGLCVSLDRFHLPFVSQDNSMRIVKFSKELNIAHVVRICTIKNDDFADTFVNKYKLSGINYQIVKVLRLGRGASLPISMFDTKSELPNGCCSTVLSPIVLPSGLVQACCGPGVNFNPTNPLNLGNWKTENLQVILRRAKVSPLVISLNNFGPKGIIDLLEVHGFSNLIKLRNEYSGICELCIDICNNRDIIEKLDHIYDDQTLRMKLIAGQAYQQSYLYLRKLGYLELPDN